jgi:hypothetical protein
MLARTNLGFFRNARVVIGQTCAVCATPVDGYTLCFKCNQHARSGLPISDRVGVVAYGINGHQSGRTMQAYKGRGGRTVQREDLTRVTVMAIVSLGHHLGCAERLGGLAVSHFATVPSLPAKPGQHPLNSLLRSIMPGAEAVLAPVEGVSQPRSLGDQHFHVAEPLPRDAHVLLVDDTWTTGGHAQSAAVALHLAGAAQVSTLIFARWLEPSFETTRPFMPSLASPDFDPLICPWTGGDCP